MVRQKNKPPLFDGNGNQLRRRTVEERIAEGLKPVRQRIPKRQSRKGAANPQPLITMEGETPVRPCDAKRAALVKIDPSEYFDLSMDTGALFWRTRPRFSVAAGDRAGYVGKRGHRVITLGGMEIRADHIIWRMTRGYWPRVRIVHKNGITDDDRPDNLAEAGRYTRVDFDI